MAKKQSSIQIHDARPSKKNPNAKYIVKSVGKNGELLEGSEAVNDYKAVTTHLKAMSDCWCSNYLNMFPAFDFTKEQRFAKKGFPSGLKK